MRPAVTEAIVRRIIREELAGRVERDGPRELAAPTMPTDPIGRFLALALRNGRVEVHNIRAAADDLGILFERVLTARGRLDVRVTKSPEGEYWELPAGLLVDQARRQCTATTSAGKACKAQPIKDGHLCPAHDPAHHFGTTSQAGEAGRTGGRPIAHQAPDEFMALKPETVRVRQAQEIWRKLRDGARWHDVATSLGMTVTGARSVAVYPFGTSAMPVDWLGHYE